LGYVSVPVSDYSSIERSVAFYETTFRSSPSSSSTTTNVPSPTSRPRRPTSSSSVASRRRSSTPSTVSVSGGQTARGPSSMGGSNSGGQGVKKRQSFRLVDVERFVEDLTTYIWMGNGPRASHPALCLLHKTVRRAPNLAHSGHHSNTSHTHHAPTLATTTTMSSSVAGAASSSLPIMSPNPSGSGAATPSSPGRAPHFLFPPSSSIQVPLSPGGDSNTSAPVSPTLSPAGSTTSLPLASAGGATTSSSSIHHVATSTDLSSSSRPRDQLFLGLAMAVPDLDQCLRALRDAPAGISHSRLEIQATGSSNSSSTSGGGTTSNVPRYISLYDPALIPVEITDGVLNLALNMAAMTAAVSSSATLAAGLGLLSGIPSSSTLLSSTRTTSGSTTATALTTPSTLMTPSMHHRPRPPQSSSSSRTELGLPSSSSISSLLV
jgi:hypothetical protein